MDDKVISDKLISIIVPVYNVEKYLKKCVYSILNQSYKNLEVILVNDGSTDNSGKICDELSREDSRINVYHKDNGGLSDARNYGVAKANGEYVGFVDSDDYIDQYMYENLYKAIRKYNTQIAECGITRVYKNNKLRPHYDGEEYSLVVDREGYLKEYLENRKVYGAAVCKLLSIDLAKVLKFPDGKVYEDVFYTLELLKKVDKYTLISGNYYYYYIRGNSITTKTFSSRDMDYIEIIDKIGEYTLNNYTKLKEKLFIRQGFAYLSIFNQIIQLNDYRQIPEYSILIGKLKNIRSNIIFNKLAPKSLKIAIILLNINEGLYKKVLKKYKKYEVND
ncbi:MAG: glycosyltransferase [Streptococcus sp.]|nr:MAG: glycosyltransferase [Streptococcus sp.]